MSKVEDMYRCQGSQTCGYIYDPDRGIEKETFLKGHVLKISQKSGGARLAGLARGCLSP